MNEWSFETKENESGLTLVRGTTGNTAAAVPDTIDGLPVTEIGRHAFSEGNEALEVLTLPATVRRLGDYAFFGCGNLRELRMSDSVELWGGGVFTNCRDLCRLDLTMTGPRFGAAMAAFAQELSGELEISVHYTDGREAMIVLPEYVEYSEERSGSHQVFFSYEIQGAGYTYHHCFEKRQLNFRIYDKLWDDLLRRAYDPGAALRLALARLRRPVDLSPSASDKYSSFIKKRAGEAILALTEAPDAGGLAFVLDLVAPAPGAPVPTDLPQAVAAALALAREQRKTEATALLLQFNNQYLSAKDRSFDL